VSTAQNQIAYFVIMYCKHLYIRTSEVIIHGQTKWMYIFGKSMHFSSRQHIQASSRSNLTFHSILPKDN